MLSFILVPLYTTKGVLSSVAEYGEVSVIFSYFVLFNVVLAYGLETAFFRFYNKYEDKDTLICTSLISLIVSSFFFFIIALIFQDQIANYIDINVKYINLVIWILLFDALVIIPFAWLRATQHPMRYPLIKIINVVINIGLNLFFLLALKKLAVNNSFFEGIYKANFDLRYKFNNGYMLKENALVSPFISTGYGYNKFKQVQDGYTNEFRANTYSLGTGFRLNSRGKLSMEYQSSYHKNFDNAATNHFQHVLGLNYGINGKNNQKQAPQFIDPFENANITLIPVEKDIVAVEATIAAPIVTATLPITESNNAVEVVAHKPIEKEYFIVLGAYGLPETASNAKQKALNIDKNAQIINFKHIYRIAIPVGNDSLASITRLNHVKKMYPDAWILGQTKANTEVVLAQTETKSNATNSNTTSASKEEETKTYVSKMEYMHISADEHDAPKGYYVIVASFAEERFALNYINNVKKTNPNVIRLTSNKTIRIGYFVGSNEQKAEMKLTEIRQQVLPSSWMLVNE